MIALYLIWVLVAQNLHGATEGSKGIWSMQDLTAGCIIWSGLIYFLILKCHTFHLVSLNTWLWW